MGMIVEFSDDCEWKGCELLEAYIKETFAHAKINAVEIYVGDVDYDNGEEAELFVKELAEPSGEFVEKEYRIHLFEDCAIRDCWMFAHFLWEVDDCGILLIDQAIYQVTKEADGEYYFLCIAEET